MLDEGVRQSVDMLVFDFSVEGRAQWDRFDRKASVRLAGRSYPGLMVRETPDWVWTRVGKGWMQAMNGHRIAAALPASPMTVQAPAAEAPALRGRTTAP